MSYILNVVYLVSQLNPYAECHYAECHYAECHYAECHYAERHGTIKMLDKKIKCKSFRLNQKNLKSRNESQSQLRENNYYNLSLSLKPKKKLQK